jgi:hypothetical protein
MAESADAATRVARYLWLSILASTETPDPEEVWDREFQLLCVVPIERSEAT